MIDINHISSAKPYKIFKTKYNEALNAGQKNIEAVCISSYQSKTNEVDSRYVNLKYIKNEEFIFFTNYNSPKASAFRTNNQIAAIFFWPSTNIQIRIKAKIKRTSNEFNQRYFSNRIEEKNALAISSNQSQLIDSYSQVKKNYEETLATANLNICPEYWGGYSFTPLYFEFWEGHHSRINKREVYERNDNDWNYYILQP